MNTNEAISKPSTFYKKPEDILISDALNDKQKLKALQNWKQSCIQRQDSASEGMTGKDQSEILSLVSEALRKLKKRKESQIL